MSGGASGTISIPFVYLKARGTNSIPMKKAQLPSNLKTLFKICNRLFQKYGEVKTIYNSDGSVIKDISDVPPGSTLYVSNREANENETIASRQGIFALGRPPEPSPNDKDKNLPIENNDSFNALFGNKDGRKSGKGVFRNRDQQLQNESLRRNQEKQNSINQSLERQKKKQEDKKRQQQEAERQRLLEEERRRKQQEEEERRRRQQEEEERRRKRQEQEEEEDERRRQQEEEEERKRYQSQHDEDYDYDEQEAKITSDYSRKMSNSPRNSERNSARNSERNSARNSARSSPRNSPRDSPRNKDLASDLSASDDSSFDPQMFLELFSKVLDNEDLNDDVGDELDKSEQWMKKFLSLAPQFENEQMANWYSGLYDVFTQIGFPVSFLDKPVKKSNKSNKGENGADDKNYAENDTNNDTELYGKQEILQFVRDTIVRHRFISSQNYVDYNFNIAIVGPRNSGKSSILSCFASEIMKELSVTDNWRRFFLFPINFKVFAPFYEDLSALYATMVDMVVSYLCWQAPFYSMHAAAIKRLLMSSINVQLVGASSTSSATKSQRRSTQANQTTSPVPSMFSKAKAPPVVSKNSLFYRDVPRFAHALQKAAQEIFTVWNEPDTLNEFLTLLYSLPSIVAKAAGFSKVLFLIDNIEFADVEIEPTKPFNQGNENSVVYNIEIIQYILSSQHFVVTGEEQKRIFESLSPVEEKYLDLESRIDFVSTIGIIKVDESDNRLIKTEIQDEPLPFTFSIEACCGVPAFLQMWVELNDEFDEFEDDENDENSDEKEEGRILLITHAQQVINVLFIFDDKLPLFVTSVKRTPKEAEQQSHS